MRHKLIIICSLIFLSVLTNAQTQPLYFKIDSPHFIPINKDFDISLTCRLAEARYESADLYILPEDGINLKDVSLKNFRMERRLKFRETVFPGSDDKAYKIRIPLDDPLFKLGTPFQLLLTCSGFSGNNAVVNFAAEIKRLRNGTAFYSSLLSSSQTNLLDKAKLNFYRPFKTAGSAVVLPSNASFTLTFDRDRSYQNLLVEFWAKLNSSATEFFNVYDINSGDTLIALVNTPFRMVYAKESENMRYFNSTFASKNSWTHFSVLFSRNTRSIDVYADDIKLFSIPYRNVSKLSDCVFSFLNDASSGSILIDLLKIWDFKNDIDLSFRNKNYISYSADSSSLFLKYDFDSPDQLINSERSAYKIQLTGGNLRESDAPIFPRAPELSITRYSGYYSVEWQGRDVANVLSYSLEKSTDNRNFDDIYSADAEKNPDKIYYFTDQRDDANEIVVYRLKQVNKDGSIIYSSQIKIGQGQKKTFSVEQNYPNPFNPLTSITVNILESSEIEIRVYDLVGKQIALLHSGPLNEGLHSFQFDGTELPSGIYFFEVKSPKSLEVRKMILAK